MSISKSVLYTGTGDSGTTSLVSGRRVAKYDLRINAYGTVDELNSHLGVVNALPGIPEDEKKMVTYLQNKLFDLGAYLANDNPDAPAGVTPQDILRIQAMIDETDAKLPALNRFVLPGGTMAAAQCHVARTVCRRAERLIVALAESEPVSKDVLVFVNRLSDFLFALARYANINAGQDEIFWEKNCR